MILVCITLGTIFLLITIWFCFMLYDDFCAGGGGDKKCRTQQNDEDDEVQEKRKMKRKSRRRHREEDFDDEEDISRKYTVSQLRKSQFGGNQKPSHHHHPKSKFYFDNSTTPTSLQNPADQSKSDVSENSSAMVDFSRYVSSRRLSSPTSSCSAPTPRALGAQNSAAQNLAKYTEEQKKLNFKT